uniref:Uncharacterized protein n=1 Tax=Hyaloperonospora arabidopsidis (strain Emoy2) TaxID=559515 RepID=M4C4R5_HYAAE
MWSRIPPHLSEKQKRRPMWRSGEIGNLPYSPSHDLSLPFRLTTYNNRGHSTHDVLRVTGHRSLVLLQY